MNVEVRHSIELLKGQSKAIPNFVIRNSLFDIYFPQQFNGGANKNKVPNRPVQDVIK